MRIASHIGRYLRGCNFAKKFSARSFHSSEPQRLAPPQDWPPILTPSEAVMCLVGAGLVDLSYEWISFHGSNMFEYWKAEKKMQKMQEELDRKKKESPEAYLEMMHREIETLKLKLSQGEVAEWEVNSYERKVAVLKSNFYAWTKGEDTAPPQ